MKLIAALLMVVAILSLSVSCEYVPLTGGQQPDQAQSRSQRPKTIDSRSRQLQWIGRDNQRRHRYRYSYRFNQGVTSHQLLSMNFQITDLHGIATDLDCPCTIEVLPDMPSMGHGTSPVVVTHLSPGQYLFEEISLFMLGAWEIEILIRDTQTNEVLAREIIPQEVLE